MRLSITCSLIMMMSACTQQKETTTETKADSTQTSQEILRDPIQLQNDTSIFISSIIPFDETREFYTPVYTLDNLEEGAWESIATKLDSVVYVGDDETKRTRLPLNIAKQYFNLSGLNRISLYNQVGNRITDATLVRIEYLEDLIESQYVAVFKPTIPSAFTSDVYYCITASADSLKTISVGYKELTDTNLTAKLFQRFKIDSTKVWEINHLQFLRDNSIWTAIALDQGSFLIETKGNESTILYQSNEDYSIMEVMLVHIEINTKPVLLVTFGKNETDWIWTSLMVYSSKGYEVVNSSRIR